MTTRPEQVDKGEHRTLVLWSRDPDASPQARLAENPSGERHKDVVNTILRKEENGCAEPGEKRRRQNPGSELGNETLGHPGVAGRACGDGLLREGGRSRMVSEREAKSEGPTLGRRGAIRATPETRPRAMREVGEARSSHEPVVTTGERRGLTSVPRLEENETAHSRREA